MKKTGGRGQRERRKAVRGAGRGPVATCPQALQRMGGLRKELDQRLAAFNQFLGKQVRSYNTLAAKSEAPTLLAGAPIAVRGRVSATRR